jgi:Uma2 family endonuclease
MATKTLLTIADYAALEEPVGVRYELSKGELIVTPSSSPRHNIIRDRLARALHFPGIEHLGMVFTETDVELGASTVRRPDVAFIRAKRIAGIDLEQVPLPVAPDLVIEIVSKNDRADDLMDKVFQYLEAGATAVWLMYPRRGVAHRYTPGRVDPEVRTTAAGDVFEEPSLLPGFSMAMRDILA